MYNNNYNNGSYSRAPYRNNFQSGNRGAYRPTNRQGKKHSGAKFGYCLGEQSRPFVRGWRFSRRFGMITYMCSTYKNTKRVTSKSGKEWENWCCVITFADGKTQLTSCLYNVQAKKVVLSSLGLVINPSAPNGGYCGKFTKSR
jgi:hypothetical protein